MPLVIRRAYPFTAILLVAAMAALAGACASEQIRAVRRFNDEAPLVQVACLDVNGDGRVDAGDGDPALLPDITGDGETDEADVLIVGQVSISLPDGSPPGCEDGRGPLPDWQVSKPPEVDCATGERELLLLAVGGGAVELGNEENAAGARWMVERISDEVGLPSQISSVAPGLNGTSAHQPDSEAWAFAYLNQRLRLQPCLSVMLLGHSHGGAAVTATARRLEEAGLGDRVLLVVVIDRVTFAYSGDTESLPQTSPVFDVYLAAPQQQGEHVAGRGIDQPNVENLNVVGMLAPEHGEQGGDLVPVTHTTVDNSPQVLDEVLKRVSTAVERLTGG